MVLEGAGPEDVELLVALLLRNAFYGRFRADGDHRDVLELDEVGLDDEHSVCGVGGLVVGGEDPVIAACEAVGTADHHVVRPDDRVVVPNYDVVVLDEPALDLLQQLGDVEHLLVDVLEDAVPEVGEGAGDGGLSGCVPAESIEVLELVVLLEELEEPAAEEVDIGLRAKHRQLLLAIEVLVEGVLEKVDGSIGPIDQRGVDAQTGEVILGVGEAEKNEKEG